MTKYNVLTFRRTALIKWSVIALFLLLSLATVLSLNYLDRFYVEKEQLLQDSNFLSGSMYWKHQDASGVSYMANRLIVEGGKVFQNIPIEAPGFYRFEYDVGVKDVVPHGVEEWASGNVAIIFRNEFGERTGSNMVTALVGSRRMISFSEILSLKKEYASVDFAFRVFNATGQLIVANPVMSKLQEYPLYKGTRIAIVVAWLAAFVVLAIFAMRIASWGQVIGAILIGIVTIVGVLLPLDLILGLNQKLAAVLPQTLLSTVRAALEKVYYGPEVLYPGAEVSKLGHLVVFMCLGMFVGWHYKRFGIYFSVAIVVAFASATEALQVLVNGRSPSVNDLLLDSTGGLLGLVICIIPLWFYRWFPTMLARRRYEKRQRRLY